MCGINGYIDQRTIDEDLLVAQINAMNNLIINRGPDDDGVYTYKTDGGSIAMGMRRLSIIDLDSGKQPIANEKGNITIVFNGEIYNYRELKAYLVAKGINFKTSSDTEVILKLYESEGVSSFSKLDGMFAFSIHDKIKNKLYIARDYFGEKPLYYTSQDGKFLWASELKSIIKFLPSHPTISVEGLNLFFRLTYIPAPYSIYEGIEKLEANHYIEFNLENHSFEIHEISKELNPKIVEIPFSKAKERVKELVYNSVESRSVSDVPLGTFLSGGVDSSIVSLCLSQAEKKKINTFSIGFKKSSYDETDKSKLVAELINSNHHEFIIDEDDFKDNINEILLNFDEPFSDSAALPTHLISKKTREHVTVALTGDGGDEVFGGYTKYYMGKMNSKYTNIVPKPIHNYIKKAASTLLATKDDKRGKRFKAKKFLNNVDYDGQQYWNIISLANTQDQLNQLLLPKLQLKDLYKGYKSKLKIDKAQSLTDFRQIDKILSLEGGMLPKVDRTSMMNSLECRAPFLNKELWNFTNSLPENYLMKGWNKKYILKEAFKDQFPENFLERSKSGFGSPVGDWLRSSLRAELETYIESKFLEKQNLFNINYVRTLVNNHLSSKQDNTFQVWAFYCFQKWYTNIYEKK